MAQVKKAGSKLLWFTVEQHILLKRIVAKTKDSESKVVRDALEMYAESLKVPYKGIQNKSSKPGRPAGTNKKTSTSQNKSY